MIADMNHMLHSSFYPPPLPPSQQQPYKAMNAHHNMVLPQPLKLFKGNTTNNNNASSRHQQNDLSMLNNNHYYPLPTTTFNQAYFKPCETITPIYNNPSWKLGRTGNDFMLPNEVVVPSSSSPSPPPPPHQYTYHHNVDSHGLSMHSSPSSLYNNSFSSSCSPPPVSVSSSTSTTSSSYGYNTHYQGTTNSSNYNGLLYLSDSSNNSSNHHNYHRRSSVNTSRSSSPATSSCATSPYQESTRSPSPAVVNKRYACHFCNKRFTRPSSLTTHIYSHTGEKPFKCPVNGCGRHFSVVSNLRRHAKVHGNICLKSSGSSSTAHTY